MSYPTKKLGEVIDINFGERITRTNNSGNKYPVYGGGGESFRTDRFNRENEFVVSRFAIAENCVRFVEGKFWLMDSGGTFSIKNESAGKSDKKFVGNVLLMKQKEIYNCARGGAQKNIDVDFFKKIKIPLPPLAIQKQIVERLDKIAEAQKLNDDLIKKTDELFQSLLHKELNPAGKDWEVKKLSEIGEIITGTTPLTKNREYWDGEFLWATPTDIKKDTFMLTDTPKKLSREGYEKTRPVPKNAILVTCIASIGKMAIAGSEMATNQQINSIVCNENSDPLFIFFSLQKDKKKLISLGKTTAVPIINKSEFGRIKIFLPPLEIQKQIVTKLSAVQDYKKQLLEQKTKLKELFNSSLSKSMSNH